MERHVNRCRLSTGQPPSGEHIVGAVETAAICDRLACHKRFSRRVGRGDVCACRRHADHLVVRSPADIKREIKEIRGREVVCPGVWTGQGRRPVWLDDEKRARIGSDQSDQNLRDDPAADRTQVLPVG